MTGRKQRAFASVAEGSGHSWFVLTDVCEVLELSNSRKVASSLDERDRGVTSSYTLGGKQQVTTVNESGLYDVIFQSRTAGRYRPTRASISDAWSSRKRRGFVAG
ncbi:BRO-N domain-containing protein [Corynebacterium pilbarense]|uniref:BRO-N domain-containing protein n=1 Tax=Corynebacterium pilbarense TaxID=1288393 RepID=UPI003622D11E